MNSVEPATTRRPLSKRVMHWLRRGHLYFGLFLFPWAVLYGVTAFLFNHPGAFADRPTNSFGPDTLVDTPMAEPPDGQKLAGQVVAALQARASGSSKYELVRPEAATFTRENAFATVKAGDQTINVLIDVSGRGGTVRSRVEPKKEAPERAPFAIGANRPRRGNGGGRTPAPAPPAEDALIVDQSFPDRVKATVPTVIERLGLPSGEVTVTSVPDLTFLMEGHGKTWLVTYSPMTGTVSGNPDDVPAAESLTVRQFLLRLHLSHGYPSSGGARWYWAIVVDAMAGVMVFWGVSGLLMWWQIKATRAAGLALIVASAVAATALGIGMHAALSP